MMPQCLVRQGAREESRPPSDVFLRHLPCRLRVGPAGVPVIQDRGVFRPSRHLEILHCRLPDRTLIPAALLVTIYYFYIRKGFLKKRAKTKEGPMGFSDELAGIWSMITASKRTTLMGIIIGIVAGLHIFVMKGMQIRFGISNFGEILNRMDTADSLDREIGTRGTVFDPGYFYVTTQEAQLGAWILEKFGRNMTTTSSSA